MAGANWFVLVFVWAGWAVASATAQEGDPQWLRLFDGQTLNGWRAGENERTFKVVDGAIVADGRRSHLFYEGPVEDANFGDFELKVDVMTELLSNGGIYFHTEYQETGWPARGFEAQINNTYIIDPRKTGSLYRMEDVSSSPVKDGVWFTMHIIVRGKRVVIRIDGETVVDWTEPDPPRPPANMPGRVLGRGTFALQAHDPISTVRYKNIYVKPLPPLEFPIVDYHVHLKGGLTLEQAIAISKQRGVKFGIAENCGLGFPATNDEALKAFLEKMEGQPVYTGLQAEGREWVELFSPEMIAKFDYVFTDAMTFIDQRGERIRLWIPEEVQVDNEQDFMEMLVDEIVAILTNEPIDIYVNPTFLPACIAEEYETLWTDERMATVIDAAVTNDVAIEINARYRIPSERFIGKAKAAGAKFAFGTNNAGSDLGQLAYSRMIARRCGLIAQDLFTPKPAGQKPVQTKGLPQ